MPWNPDSFSHHWMFLPYHLPGDKLTDETHWVLVVLQVRPASFGIYSVDSLSRSPIKMATVKTLLQPVVDAVTKAWMAHTGNEKPPVIRHFVCLVGAIFWHHHLPLCLTTFRLTRLRTALETVAYTSSWQWTKFCKASRRTLNCGLLRFEFAHVQRMFSRTNASFYFTIRVNSKYPERSVNSCDNNLPRTSSPRRRMATTALTHSTQL